MPPLRHDFLEAIGLDSGSPVASVDQTDYTPTRLQWRRLNPVSKRKQKAEEARMSPFLSVTSTTVHFPRLSIALDARVVWI